MKHSKVSLFLIELIIALFFFSLASTVCIRLFVKSHTLTKQTTDLNYAVTAAQNMAEAYLGCEGDLDEIMSLYDNCFLYDTGRGIYVMDDGYITDLTTNFPSEDGLISADISVQRSGETESIYSLHVEHHIAERSGGYDN